MTNDVQQLDAQIKRLMAAYGWVDVKAMTASKAWADTLARLTETAKRTGAPPPGAAKVIEALGTKTSEGPVEGWVLGADSREEYNEDANNGDGGYETVAEGVRIVLPDGSEHSFLYGGKMEWPPLTRVIANPVRVAENIERGTRRLTGISPKDGQQGTAVVAAPPLAAGQAPPPFPDCTFKRPFEWLMGLPESRPGSKGRGVIRAANNNNLTFVTGRVGSASQIAYFEAGSSEYSQADTLKYPIVDTANLSVGAKLERPGPGDAWRDHIQGVCDAWNISPDANSFRDLAGVRVAAWGRIGLLLPYDTSDWGKRKDEAEADLVQRHKEGFFQKNRKGRAELVLRNRMVKGPNGPERQDHVVIAGKKVYDIREREPGQYQLSVSAWEEGGMPWFSLKDPGAFLVFPDRMTGVERAPSWADRIARQLELA